MEPFDLDILSTTGFSDLMWSLKRYEPERYKYSSHRNPEEIKKHVLDSKRVKHIVEETAKEQGKSISDIRGEAKAILDEMGHNFNMKTLRFMAFMMKKILSTLLRKVMVNKKGLERLREASSHNPIVLVPNHRSYMDFLLVSFICFYADLPLPFIAAAQDFMHVRVVRRLFRQSGAFFMKRSFVSDKLYWVIFTEYIQNQLQTGDKPLEFFIEGTRSRTGKFLHPKLGLLSMVVDLYANAGVPNILLCPISISYDRVLEEPLFAYELLGIPKPRESLRGLIKSRSVLTDDYGNIYVNFGQLIPLSNCIEGKLDRMATSLIPRHLLLYLTDEEKEVVRQTGYEIIARLQASMVVTSPVLVAAIMLQNQDGLFLDDIMAKFHWLQELFKKFSIPLAPPDKTSLKEIVKDGIALQKSCLDIDSDMFVRIKDPDTGNEVHHSSAAAHASRLQHHVISSVKDVLGEAAIHLQLAYKRNTLLPYFFGIGMISMAAQKQKSSTKELGVLSDDFKFLSQLLVQEVSGLAESLPQVFQKTMKIMQEHCIFNSNSAHSQFSVRESGCIDFASGLWLPLLTAYWMVCEYFIKVGGKEKDEKHLNDVPKGAQHLAAEYVLSGTVKYFEVLSLELLKNATKAFIELGVIAKMKRPEGTIISVLDKSELRKLHKRIGEFLDIPLGSRYVSPPISKM